MTKIFDDISETESFAFWSVWFKAHKEKVSRMLGHYTVPGTAIQYQVMLNGRTCPFCQGEGFIVLKGNKTLVDGYTIDKVYCVCSLLEAMDEYNYKYQSLHQLRTVDSLEEVGKPEAKAITKLLKLSVKDFMRKPMMWQYLGGGYGAGKTHILYAVKSRFRGLALYVTASDLNGFVYEATGKHIVNDLVAELIEAPILLLDDFGKEYESEYLYSVLFRVIDARYARRTKAPMFITSNKTTGDFATYASDHIRAIADRLSDRLLVNQLVSLQDSYRTMDAGVGK